jgi:WD40 repeat protein
MRLLIAIIAPADDQRVIIRDTATGQEVASVSHTQRIWSFSLSPDYTLLATASRDTSAKIWQAANGLLVRTLLAQGEHPNHYGYVWSVAFSPNGRLVATGGYDGVARIWDVATGTEVQSHQVAQPPVARSNSAERGRPAAGVADERPRQWLLRHPAGRRQQTAVGGPAFACPQLAQGPTCHSWSSRSPPPVGDWNISEHFATADANCVYIGRLAGKEVLERLATRQPLLDSWLNPGIPATKV